MLRFTRLSVENLGPFKGNQVIDFTNERGVTIIWGNNGRGKTTLLNIFRYALFGRFKDRRGVEVNLTTLPNIEGRDEGNYSFKVVLQMLNNETSYELTRQCKVRQGVTVPRNNDDYEILVFLKENGSILAPEMREHVLKLIMPDEVSRFFLFDGELLQEYEELLKEGTDVGATIKESIEKILGVPVLTNSAIDTEDVVVEYKTEKSKIAQSNIKTQKIASQMEGLEAQKREHKADLVRLQCELEDIRDERSRLEGDLHQRDHIKTLLERMDSLNKTIEEKKICRDDLLTQITLHTKEAWRDLVSCRVESILVDINNQLVELERKETKHAIDKHYLAEMDMIVKEHHCQFCNQDVDDKHIQAIIERIQNDVHGVVGGLDTDEQKTMQKLRIRKASLEGMRVTNKTEMLKFYEGQLDKIEVEVDDLMSQLKTVQGELKLHGDIDELAKDTRQTLSNLMECLSKYDVLKNGIEQEKGKLKECDSAIATLEDRLNKISTNADMVLAGKKVALCEEIHEIFEKGIAAYRDKLKTEVEKDATELFVNISNDPDYVQLKINENYGLSMVHKSGALVPLRSAGFEHIVALSLIGALHKNAPLRGPIIMDSPFGRLDPEHKKNITMVLPHMSEQIILLAYTHEIDEQQARETLAGALKKEYRLTRYSSFHTEIEVQ